MNMRHFMVEHLPEDRLSEAWPLLRLAGSESLPEWWESDARKLLGRGGGVLVARDESGAIHGLATYAAAHRPGGGRLLRLEDLISFELNRREPVKQALRSALERIADALGCNGLALPLRKLSRGARMGCSDDLRACA